jgi:hypothetical protein
MKLWTWFSKAESQKSPMGTGAGDFFVECALAFLWLREEAAKAIQKGACKRRFLTAVFRSLSPDFTRL